jgi:hypothetical protein
MRFVRTARSGSGDTTSNLAGSMQDSSRPSVLAVHLMAALRSWLLTAPLQLPLPQMESAFGVSRQAHKVDGGFLRYFSPARRSR